MATSDQLTRLAASHCDFRMKFWIGGKYELATLTDIQCGDGFAPPSTTIMNYVEEDDTVIDVASTTGFTTGTIIIAPLNNEESWEVIRYGAKTATQFQNLTREQTDPNKMMHPAGATVYEWADITDYVVDNVGININESGPIIDWTASIRGVNYNSQLIQNDARIVASWRFRPLSGSMGSWTPWGVAFVGYLSDINVDKDKLWSARVISLGGYMSKTDIDATEYGKIDLAEGKTVTVSSYLKDPFQESGAGEYIGSPDLDGDQIVDGDMGTLWISADMPSSTPETPWATAWTINEVYLDSPPWIPDSLQWIELHYKHGVKDGNLNSMALVADCTTWRNESWWDPNLEQYYTVRLPDTNFLQLGAVGGSFPDDGSFALLVSNLPLFLKHFPHYAGQYVVDWRSLQWGTFELEPTGDFLSLRFYGTTIEDEIWWDGGRASWALFDYDNDGSGPGSEWSGAMIDVTSTPDGHSFRRNPAGKESSPDVAGNFKADEDAPTPGYYMDGDPEWAMIEIGTLGITLETELSSTETTSADISDTIGLTNGPAWVQLDSEIIKYDTIDRNNNQLLTLTRGEYSTTPAVHPVDTVVYQYENSTYTNAQLISMFQFRRRRVLDSNGNFITPKNFDIYASEYASPVTPDDPEWDDGLGSGGWEDYWKKLATIREFQQPEFHVAFDPVRAVNVMIVIYDMTDGERVKLNEVHIYSATTPVDLGIGYGDYDWIQGRWTSEIVKFILVTQFGVPEDFITLEDLGRQFISLTTTKGSALDAIKDICERTGCQLVFGLDSHMVHRFNPRYPLYSMPDIDVTWTSANARSVDYDRPFKHNVRQVILRAYNLETDEAYDVTFPTSPLPLGADYTVNEAIIGNMDDAKSLAQLIFNDERLPNEAIIVPVGLAEFVRPGDRHIVNWVVDEEGTDISSRNFIVIGVSYSIRFGKVTRDAIEHKSWDASFRLKEINYVPFF